MILHSNSYKQFFRINELKEWQDIFLMSPDINIEKITFAKHEKYLSHRLLLLHIENLSLLQTVWNPHVHIGLFIGKLLLK